MSNIQTPVVRFRDPRVTIERSPIVAIDQGAEYLDARRQPSNSFSADSISFNEISTGGTGMILDRKMFIEYSYAPKFKVQNVPGQAADAVVYGKNTSSEIVILGTSDSATKNDLTFNKSSFEGQPFNPPPANPLDPPVIQPYIPAVSAASRCRNSLNNILALIGLGGPHRSSGPRCLGLLQAAKTLSVTINGNPITQEVGKYINALEWYDNHGPSDHTDYSKCASYPDLFRQYRDGTFANTNPLGAYGTQLGRETRGSMWSLPYNSIVSVVNPAELKLGYYRIDGFAFHIIGNALGFITVDEIYPCDLLDQTSTVAAPIARKITMVEPIILPIFNIGEPQSRGLYGVDKFSIDVNLSSSKINQKLWSGDVLLVPGAYDGDLLHDIVCNISDSISVNSGSNSAYLHYNILKPHVLPVLPTVNTYASKQLSIKPVDLGTSSQYAVGGKPFTASSGDISYGSIPSRIYFYIKEQTESTEIQDTDVFCRIDKLSFQFTGMGSQFTACNTEQLYQMSKESGCKMSLAQWRDNVGSVVCVDFSKNVNMGLTDYAGLLGTFRCNFDISFTPLRHVIRHLPVLPNYYLYIIVVEEGVATISNSTCTLNKGTLQIDVTSVPTKFRDYDQKWVNIYGGNFVDTIKKMGHSAAKMAQRGIALGHKAVPYVKKALPYIEKGLALALPLLAAGAGISENKAHKLIQLYGEEKAIKMMKKMSGGGVVGGSLVGGKTRGGKQTSKADMAKFLKEF